MSHKLHYTLLNYSETCFFSPPFFSLRAIYGTDDQRNALHGSDSFGSSQREIRFFFPDSEYSSVCTKAVCTKNILVQSTLDSQKG